MSLSRNLALVSVLGSLVACGQQPGAQSDSKWIPIANTTKATLEMRDVLLDADADKTFEQLNDAGKIFLFGLQVISTENFHANALSLHVESVPAYVTYETGHIAVNDTGGNVLVNFETKVNGGNIEVDFSTPQELLNFQEGFLYELGGSYTASGPNSKWEPTGDRPQVRKVDQTRDLVRVDVAYPVRQTVFNGDTFTRDTKTGAVVIRFFLVRRNSLDLATTAKTLTNGYDRKLGFFGARNARTKEEEDRTPVRRFNLTGPRKIVFQLKGFPTWMIETAREAVLDWNRAFTSAVVEVNVATDAMDLGDPRYNVIKWVDGADASLNWAGTAGPTFADPITGTVISGSILINGDFLVNNYRGVHQSSQAVFGHIGGLVLSSAGSEAPVLPPFTFVSSFDDYIKGYYRETITHEVGHVMGLMHNFKGSIDVRAVDGGQTYSNSIMEYLPRRERAVKSGVGAYDINAIRWSYYGTEPTEQLPFCTHGHGMEEWNCLTGDSGDPIAYTVAGLTNITKIVSTQPIAELAAFSFAGLKAQMTNGFKIRATHPGLTSEAAAAIDAAISGFCTIKPATDLTAEARVVVAQNIKNMREVVWTNFKVEKDNQALDPHSTAKWNFLANDCFSGVADLRH